jgi:hypothetical protein
MQGVVVCLGILRSLWIKERVEDVTALGGEVKIDIAARTVNSRFFCIPLNADMRWHIQSPEK